MKIWNSYFSEAELQVRNAASFLHENIEAIAGAAQQLVKRIEKELESRWFKDNEVIKLKHDFH